MNSNFKDDFRELGIDSPEQEKLERFVTEFRDAAHSEATRDELFWAAQRARIRVSRNRPRVQHLGTFATVAATIAVVVFTALPTHSPLRVTTQPSPVVAQVDDEALLQSVSDTTSSYVPQALEPATILASEVDRGTSGAVNNQSGRRDQ